MLNSSKCKPGEEQFEKFTRNKKTFVQYDYRNPTGYLFSCVGKTLKECQDKAVAWQKKEEDWLLGKEIV